jgi:hypothetical protein
MASPFDLLIDIIHSRTLDSWKERNEKALAALFGTRYTKRAEKSVTLRAPEMKGGNDAGVPYAAYIHPSNPDAGAYGGMCFVIFPVEDAPCLVAMGIGTQGLAPDETTLGRPGHARFRFAPKPGFLIEAAARAYENPAQNYLLHIDEINRADLGKILGEAIYLLEPSQNPDVNLT